MQASVYFHAVTKKTFLENQKRAQIIKREY